MNNQEILVLKFAANVTLILHRPLVFYIKFYVSVNFVCILCDFSPMMHCWN